MHTIVPAAMGVKKYHILWMIRKCVCEPVVYSRHTLCAARLVLCGVYFLVYRMASATAVVALPRKDETANDALYIVCTHKHACM